MEGFIHLKVSPWLRRLITRRLAIIPTIIVVAVNGERGTEKLLILSQVILSLQLSFAVVPLVMFTGNRAKMGEFVNASWLKALAWTTAVVIAGTECVAAGPDGAEAECRDPGSRKLRMELSRAANRSKRHGMRKTLEVVWAGVAGGSVLDFVFGAEWAGTAAGQDSDAFRYFRAAECVGLA